jgi:hypothetical protein
MNTKRALVVSLIAAFGILSGFTGCRKPVPPNYDNSKSYDPATDAMVNPSSLFDPPPEDLSLIETEDTLYLQFDGSPNTLHPFFVSSTYDFTIVDIIYAGLFTYDSAMKWQPNIIEL